MQRRAGFTLIEMMVAVAVLGIVTAQILYIFSAQKETFTTNDRALEAQHQARTVLDFLEYDVRQAGMMVRPQVGVSAVTGGPGDGITPAPDRLCVSDPSGFEFPLSTPDPSDPNTSSTLDRPIPFETIATGYGPTQVTVANVDIDGYTRLPNPPGASDFKVGSGIIVSDGTRTHCSRIASVAPATHTITYVHNDANVGYDMTQLRAVPAHIYELDPNTLQLTRNNLVLDSGIEDFQVEFWMDSVNPNGLIDGPEWPITDLANPGIPVDTGRIGRVRITVLSRTEAAELDDVEGDNLRPAIADAVAAFNPDNFSRRLFTTSVMPRNLGKDLNQSLTPGP